MRVERGMSCECGDDILRRAAQWRASGIASVQSAVAWWMNTR